MTYTVMKKMTIALVHHCKCENFGVILDLYVEEIERELKTVNEIIDNKEQRDIIFTKLGINVSLLHICTTVRKGSRVKGLHYESFANNIYVQV